MTQHNPFTPPRADLDRIARDASVEYVGFWPRVGASLIDSLLMMMVTMPILYAVYGREYFLQNEQTSLVAGPVDVLLSWVFPIVAVLIFWIKRSATPGKMLIRAKIVDAETLRPTTPGKLLLRYIGYYLSAIPLGLGFIWIGIDQRKQGWHDKIARTVVIRASQQGHVI